MRDFQFPTPPDGHYFTLTDSFEDYPYVLKLKRAGLLFNRTVVRVPVLHLTEGYVLEAARIGLRHYAQLQEQRELVDRIYAASRRDRKNRK